MGGNPLVYNTPTMTTSTRIAEVIEASTTKLVAQCYQLYDAPPLGSLVRAGPLHDAIYGVVIGITTEGLDPSRRPIARGQQAQTQEQVYQDHPELAHLLRTHLEIAIVGHARGGSPLILSKPALSEAEGSKDEPVEARSTPSPSKGEGWGEGAPSSPSMAESQARPGRSPRGDDAPSAGPERALAHTLPPLPPRIHTFLYTCSPDELRAFTASLDFFPLLLADTSPATDEATALLLRTAATAHDDPAAFLLRAGRELARLLATDPPRLTTLLRRLS